MSAKPWTFFPGCTMDGTGSEYGHSMLAVLAALDIPVRILEDWNCCGASAARGSDLELTVRLGGRNLALAARQGGDVLVNCAACYNNLAFSRSSLRERPDEWRRLDPQAPADVPDVQHLLSLLTQAETLERIRSKRSRPLTEMKLACYYGCLLVRPGGYTRVDDAENPQSMDVLMQACGARTVDWPYKADCCGGSAALTDETAAVDLVARIFRSAMEQEVTGLVTACPMCHMNLDSRQAEVGRLLGREVALPVYHVTELLAVALGLEGAPKWLRRHLTDARLSERKCR